MRTLSRPMFNMGGPIKQGIMHGIREPYKGGGKAALVGNPVYPKTGGREHHVVVSGTIATVAAANAARIAAQRAAIRYGPRAVNWAKNKALPYMKNWFGKTTPASVTQGSTLSAKQATKIFGQGSGRATQVTMNPSKFSPNWLGRDPLVSSLGWGARTLTGPTSKSLAGKAFQFATAPSSIVAGVVYYMWPDGKERDTPPPTNIMKPGGYPEGTVPAEGKGNVLTQEAKDAFAKSQREKRVNKYLEMMGYDRSKKMAIADALIDASKIVGERGSLDPKNITQELINPIIQATSKRLDKPGQIREAVGLMAAKAEIEKDLSKETDALKTRLTELQIEGAEQTLKASKSVEGGLRKFLSDRKGKVDKDTLERISRLLADEHGETFVKTEEGTVPSGDGIYMIGDGIYRVTDSVPKQIA